MAEPDLKRADFQPYFLAWDSVLHYPNPNPQAKHDKIYGYSGNEAMIPCHRHRACNALVCAKSKYPPRVCPGCQLDTSTEIDPSAVPLEMV